MHNAGAGPIAAGAHADAAAASVHASGVAPLVSFPLGTTLLCEEVSDNLNLSLQRVQIVNERESAVQLRLHSPGDALRWMQLRAGAEGSWPWHGATNTVSWAQAGGVLPDNLRMLRHMAANVEPVDQATLEPRATLDLYVEANPRVLLRDVSTPEDAEAQRAARTMRERQLALALDASCGDEARHVELPVRLRGCTPQVEVHVTQDAAPSSATAHDVLVADLGDVVVGEHVERTVCVRNTSAIACLVQLQRQGPDQGPGGSPIALLDAASGDPAPYVDLREEGGAAFAPLAIAPHAELTLRVLVRPREACADYEETIMVENLVQPAQTRRLLVRANILGAATDEALAVLNGSALDFGDCCGGQWTRQVLVLKNQADCMLDVFFRTEKGVEATFQLADPSVPREDEASEAVTPPGSNSPAPLESSGTLPPAAAPPKHDESDSDLAGDASGSGSDVSSSGAAAPGSGASSAADSRPAGAPDAPLTPPLSLARGDASSASDAGASSDTTSSSAAAGGSSEASAAPAGAGAAATAHRAAFPAHVRMPAGSGTAGALVRRITDPVALLRGGEQQHNLVDDLPLRPGSEYRVVVAFRPRALPADETWSAGRLRDTTFRVYLDYARTSGSAHARRGRQRRTLVCHTRTCTPFISVQPKVVDFGTASVGARKTSHIAVTNHSDLGTLVAVRFVSKVLSMFTDQVAIPAQQTVELKIDFFPRRVNESYRKQITVTNLLNRANDQIFEVRARNVDLQRVSFHSLFYRILTPSGSNFIDFGDVNINAPRVRCFTIENMCRTPLSLEMSVAHPEDLVLYLKQDAVAPRAAQRPASPERTAGAGATGAGSGLKERLLEALSTDAPRVRRARHAHEERSPSSPRKPPVNVALALKRGSRGRVTFAYGPAVTFKDRSALRMFEPLDLASGPPVDASRMGKSKQYGALRTLGKHGPPGPHAKAAPPAPPPSAPAPPTADTTAGSTPPALTGRRRTHPVLSDALDVARLDLDALLAALEAQPSSLATVPTRSLEAEERFVRTEINLRRALQESIDAGRLVPIGMLEVPPHAEVPVVAVYTPNGSTRPHIQGTARKQDSRIFLRLLEFDASRMAHAPEFEMLQGRDVDELPVRDLMVRSNVCRSMLELGQPHINFGQMETGERRERKLWIQNRSEWALRYCIRKSGSIASGDIRLALGRYGVVPGHATRGVDFTFSPSLSGAFHERLLVANVADPDNDQAIVLKANVRKVPNFGIDPPLLDFGTCRAGSVSMPESILVSNTTGKSRTFVVSRDESMHSAVPLELYVAASRSPVSHRPLSREEEEEVETLLQKLKIASRKGNLDKLAKYQERLQRLGVPAHDGGSSSSTPGASGDAANGSGSEAPAPSAPAAREVDADYACTFAWRPHPAPTPPAALQFVLAPTSSLKLLLRLHVPRGSWRSTQHVAVAVKVNEAKNRDETRSVVVRAALESE